MINVNPVRRALGSDLRRIRHEQARPLRGVAAVAHVSPSYLSDVERGRREPSWATLTAICGALGMSVRVSLYPIQPHPAHTDKKGNPR